MCPGQTGVCRDGASKRSRRCQFFVTMLSTLYMNSSKHWLQNHRCPGCLLCCTFFSWVKWDYLSISAPAWVLHPPLCVKQALESTTVFHSRVFQFLCHVYFSFTGKYGSPAEHPCSRDNWIRVWRHELNIKHRLFFSCPHKFQRGSPHKF